MSWKKNEDSLFEHLKDNYIPDLEWSEGEYNHYDCYSLSLECDIELKCRNKHYDDLIIEKANTTSLLQEQRSTLQYLSTFLKHQMVYMHLILQVYPSLFGRQEVCLRHHTLISVSL